jgi:DNA-binding transcriptional regulator WhiA
MKLVNMHDSKSCATRFVGSSPTPGTLRYYSGKEKLAYLIGLSLGDGNLSNPNSRAVRLRITCDNKYPNLIKRIISLLKELFPKNKIGIINRKDSCIDISCYSNDLEKILGWRAKDGSKIKQNVSIPNWIKNNKKYLKHCLRGLIETDGSIYKDRGYLMINFTTVIPRLAKDFSQSIEKFGFVCNTQINKPKIGLPKFTIRVSKKSVELVNLLKIEKS